MTQFTIEGQMYNAIYQQTHIGDSIIKEGVIYVASIDDADDFNWIIIK